MYIIILNFPILGYFVKIFSVRTFWNMNIKPNLSAVKRRRPKRHRRWIFLLHKMELPNRRLIIPNILSQKIIIPIILSLMFHTKQIFQDKCFEEKTSFNSFKVIVARDFLESCPCPKGPDSKAEKISIYFIASKIPVIRCWDSLHGKNIPCAE